jgi:hypothetical protein
LNPTQKVISDLRKFPPISNDIPEGVVSIQFHDVFKYDISNPKQAEMMELDTTIDKLFKEKQGQIDVNTQPEGALGYVINDEKYSCKILALADHVTNYLRAQEDSKYNYNYVQISNPALESDKYTIQTAKNNFINFKNIIGSEETDFSLSVNPKSKIDKCTNLFYNKYLGNQPNPGDILRMKTAFNPIIIGNSKSNYRFDLGKKIETSKRYSDKINLWEYTLLAPKLKPLKKVMKFLDTERNYDNSMLAITSTIKIDGKNLKVGGAGISGSPYFNEYGKYVGSHTGAIYDLTKNQQENSEPYSSHFVRLQQNCKTTKPVLEPKACKAIKDVDPKKVQLVMIANPHVDNPFVK